MNTQTQPDHVNIKQHVISVTNNDECVLDNLLTLHKNGFYRHSNLTILSDTNKIKASKQTKEKHHSRTWIIMPLPSRSRRGEI